VRYIYIDEAGTSANEPVTIVLGIIVDADAHWKIGEGRLAQLIETVPESLRPNFVSHATAIWGSPKYRECWTREDRLKFLHAMMGIPRSIGLPIAFGMVRRSLPVRTDIGNLSPAQIHHVWAFLYCVARADQYLRDYGQSNEVATVVAENVPEMQRFLKGIPKHLAENPVSFSPHMLTPTSV
jgi:hypothetical protein